MAVVIGITGSIGTGKTTVSKIFEEFNYSVQNADTVVHEIYTTDTDIINKINLEFEGCVKDGVVDRLALKKNIKDNPENKQKLEDIVHPVVAEKRDKFLAENSRCVLDVPLLFEVGVDEYCDVIIVISCDDTVRKKRVLARGITEYIFEMLNGLQMSQVDKIARGDIVISTNQQLQITREEVKAIAQQIEREFFNA